MSAPLLVYEATAASSLAEEVMGRSGQNLLACYQCRRCAAGCPVGDETGVTPDRLIRMILLGDKGSALNNNLVWQCVSCYTCGTRCPNDIQTARVNEALKRMCHDERVKPLKPKVKNFHQAFVGSAVRWGRVNEVEFMGFYELYNGIDSLKKMDIKGMVNELLSQLKFALPMIRKQRMHFGFQSSKGRKEIKRLMKKAGKKTGA